MPNFNKIIISISRHNTTWRFFQALNFIISKLRAYITKVFHIIIPINQCFIAIIITAIIITTIKGFHFLIAKIIAKLSYNLLFSHHSSFSKHIIIFNICRISRNRKSITTADNTLNKIFSIDIGISITLTKSNKLKISPSIQYKRISNVINNFQYFLTLRANIINKIFIKFFNKCFNIYLFLNIKLIRVATLTKKLSISLLNLLSNSLLSNLHNFLSNLSIFSK